MRIVIDMNLSPQWSRVFQEAGIVAIHWSDIGAATDPDHEIMQWAKENSFTVFTHDLDFSALLAATNANFPSVFQLRDMDITPAAQGGYIVEIMQTYEQEMESGCLVTIDRKKSKIRLLPLFKES